MKTIKHATQFFIAGIIIYSSAAYAQSIQKNEAEKLIKNFWAGFEKKDWNIIGSQLAEGFTFTSPNDDDHISATQFKERCWGTGIKIFKQIEFQKMAIDGNSALVMYNISTTENKIIHNIEYYIFSNGKIKSVEVFFGVGIGYVGIHEVK